MTDTHSCFWGFGCTRCSHSARRSWFINITEQRVAEVNSAFSNNAMRDAVSDVAPKLPARLHALTTMTKPSVVSCKAAASQCLFQRLVVQEQVSDVNIVRNLNSKDWCVAAARREGDDWSYFVQPHNSERSYLQLTDTCNVMWSKSTTFPLK